MASTPVSRHRVLPSSNPFSTLQTGWFVKLPWMHAAYCGTDPGSTICPSDFQISRSELLTCSGLPPRSSCCLAPSPPPTWALSLHGVHVVALLCKSFPEPPPTTAGSPWPYTLEPSLLPPHEPSSHFTVVTFKVSHFLWLKGSSMTFNSLVCLVHHRVLGTYHKVRA